ncbi:MAG: bifunctional proline dehydrogenase/L-glutamate gamma-semialdehyde dehydrogenase PutA [Thalassotalea sp.]
MLTDNNLTTNCPIRKKIRDYYRIDEDSVIEHILPLAEVGIAARSRAWERARQMVIKIRQIEEGKGGVDALLNEYSLSSEEGIVLMCLAEALLRIPDSKTQDSLIRDKLSKGEWSQHLGNSDSLFVNASSWGLLITGKMVQYLDDNPKQNFNVLQRAIGRLGEPVIRSSVNFAMKIMGKQFVMGTDIDEALERAKDAESKGYVYSYDMLGEGARTMADADRYYEAYLGAIHALGKAANGKGPIKSPGISVKLSAIYPRYEFTHYTKVMAEVVPRLKALALIAKKYDIGFTVDAEEAERLDISLDIIETVFSDPDLTGWQGFGLAVQAYQKRSIFVIEWLEALARKVGRTMMVRLVKGAYWDSEIKQSQADGLEDYPVYTRKAATDVCYKACAIKLMAARDVIYPQFATHNAYTVATILELAQNDHLGYEFQRLHGMGESLYDQVVDNEKVQCRVYAPVGEHEELLAYLVRRLLENGANSSFVNAIVDNSKPIEALLPDPVETLQDLRVKRHPNILMPIAMFGAERANSKGLDLSDINQLQGLKTSLDAWVNQHVKPVDNTVQHADGINIVNPVNHQELIGQVDFHTPAQMSDMVARADKAFADWSHTKVTFRANILRRTADILERHSAELIALCIKEAGKLTKDSIDEVREAVDFCRYYASQAEQLALDDRMEPRGVVLCISPWNFPLAIFLGQVAAAIATGNTVVAKPAEQTSLIAKRTLELMKIIGLPDDIVQLIFAQGKTVGETVVSDTRVQAVMFTGSTMTGRLISQILAQRGGQQVPLIAETGGQNCMVVDSTALPEQVCDDVIKSGFQSAGQRCSALRVLFIQDDIADDVLTMITGAMKELTIGDPQYLATDIGPVIDAKALNNLNAHVEYLADKAQLLHQCTIPETFAQGANPNHYLFAPRLYQIDNLAVLKQEVFGPIVHVIRFKEAELKQVVKQINQSGFGLTSGIHTRIEGRALAFANQIKAGNVYINRNIIGAVVGVQPFGGRGLSGTGPKAGGPHYLSRLVREKLTPSANDINYQSMANIDMIAFDTAKQEVEDIMVKALTAEKTWQCAPLNDRISVMRQLIAKIATVDIVDDFADDLSQSLADSRSQLTLIEKLLKKPITLPGPTGESNTLSFEPRGCVVCYADQDTTFSFWLLAIISAAATGNTVIAAVSDLFYPQAQAMLSKLLLCGAPEGLLQVVKHNKLNTLLKHPDIAGTVVDSNCARLGYFSKQLAEREGAILPVISAEYPDTLVLRLVVEKTITIDTTASGGNTSLMTLAEDDD